MNSKIARTYCDFGTIGRRSELHYHFTIETARRQFQRIIKIYHDFPGRENWRVWTEHWDGTVLCDTNLRFDI